MGTHKLVLDEDFTEDFTLIAIHCSEEPYKVAYILNQFAHLKLRRKKTDLSLTTKTMEMSFPLFGFENNAEYTDVSLPLLKQTTMESFVATPQTKKQ